MDYKDALTYIEKVSWQKSKLGLQRTRELLSLTGEPHRKLKFIHVAGTNGKGSVSVMLSSVLHEAGYKVGLYTSPYMIKFNERIQVNGIPITDDVFAEIITDMQSDIQSMQDPPTEFEIVTATAFLYFLREKCDIVVLEVGLGGELDSTNVIETPELAVITAIGYDHMRELGGTIEEIAKAKAGIIKESSDVIYFGENKIAEKVIKDACKRNNASLIVPEYIVSDPFCDLDGIKFSYKKYYNIKVPLIGLHQFKNTVLALNAAEIMNRKGWKISDESIHKGLNKTYWPGRFEKLLTDPVFIIDGAHNEHGIKAFAETYKHIFQDKKAVFLTGMMADKDIDMILRTIIPLSVKIVAVAPDNPRSLSAEILACKINDMGGEALFCNTVEEGTEKAINLAGAGGIICAVGSLYLYKNIAEYISNISNRI